MKSFDKLSKALLALLVLVALPLGDLVAQNLIMETSDATYNATCGGVIKMKSTTGQIVRNNSNPLGTDQVNAIDGIVDWAATSATQTVQGLYYERMVMSGGAQKIVADGVYITGAACPTPLTGYNDLATYPFYISTGQLAVINDFQGTFHYIGTGQSTFPVTTDDSYNNLALTGTNHIVPAGTTTVQGTISLPTGPLDVNGILESGTTSTLAGIVNINSGGDWRIGTGDITFNGNVNVSNGGILNGGSGDIIIGSSSTLALTGNTAIVDLDGSEELIITGSFTNSGNGTNLSFDCASIVTYNGGPGQLILPTITANPYGILALTNSNKVGGTASYGNNIEICGNFSLNGGNLNMLTNNGYVNMLNQTSTATYSGLNEVEGSFRRQFTSTASGPYTFNNSGTQLTFTEAPDAAGYYQLFVDGGTNPVNYVPNTDVNRRIIPSYNAALGSVEYTLQVAYLQSELPNTWATGLDEGDLKYFEADGPATTQVEKVAGSGYSRTAAGGSSFGLLGLGGILNGTGTVDGIVEKNFTSLNDLVLRASNTMYSVVDGRWSNPNVWDEGRIPVSDDNIEVRHLVYVGIDGPFAGTTGGTDNTPTLNTRSEFDDYGTNPAASTIVIANNYANASLVVGNEDNGTTYIHKTSGTTGVTFRVANETTTVNANLFTLAKNAVAKADVNGLWLTPYVTGTLTGVPTVGTLLLENRGAINNQGIIELGN